MIGRVVAWSANHPRTVAAAMVCLALVGERGRRGLARDAIPDLSDPRLLVVAEWMGHPATQVAVQVANVIAGAIDGTAGVTAVRASSMSGMAFLDVVFDDTARLRGGREEVVARLDRIRPRLPPAVRLRVGPEASSTGWVLEYALTDPTRQHDLLALRRLQDDVIRPALAAISGVAEVASLGGAVDAVVVEARPERLRAGGRAFSDLVDALTGDPGRRPAPGDVEALPVGGGPGAPSLRVRDVARVRRTADMANGAADYGGRAAVGGIVVARRDADPSEVVGRAEQVLARARATLPPGVNLIVVYSRSKLATRVEQTLLRALGEEIAVVVLVILIFLLHWRSALVPMATLGLVLLTTFAGMWILNIPATVMSLGGIGIALGMAIDAEVVALEAGHRALEASARDGSDRRARLLAAAGSFAPAVLTALIIAALAFLPVFAFTGETGRLLRPLAATKTLVIVAAAAVALTAAPALRDGLLRGKVVPELANPVTRALVAIYRPMVHFVLSHPALTLVTAALAVVSCLPIVPRLGGDFLPRVDEGDLLFMPTTLAGIPPDEAAMQLARQDRALASHPEIASVFGKAGRADSATDPAPFSMVETTIQLRDRSEWPLHPRPRWFSGWAPATLRRLLAKAWPETTPLTTEELIADLDRDAKLPGWTSAWTAPARNRMDMVTTGVRTPVGVRIIADDARLDELATRLRAVLGRVAGTHSVVSDARGGEIWPAFVTDPDALARHGVDGARVRSTAELVLTGGALADIQDHGQPVRLRIAADAVPGRPADQLAGLTVRAASGQLVPLTLLGRPSFATVPEMVRSERGRSVSYCYVSLHPGTNVAAYVEAARREVEAAAASGALALRAGEAIEWTGQYQLLVAGQRRLTLIIPIVVLSMFGLLLIQFRNLTEALIVLASVPFALVGSVWMLYLLRYPMSAPVWVGLLSVIGLAMQTGVVMVVYVDAAFYRALRDGKIRNRDDIVTAHAEGTILRLRPKLMTIATMAAGLLPLMWASGAGAEIMRQVAAPMLGGLATSALLTLEVLPVLYTIWRTGQLARAARAGVPLTDIVGPPPRWAA